MDKKSNPVREIRETRCCEHVNGVMHMLEDDTGSNDDGCEVE